MRQIPLAAYQGQAPTPFAIYRPAGVGALRQLPAFELGIAHYSALAVLEAEDKRLKAREDALVAAAESAESPEAVLEALNASADERSEIAEKREKLGPQMDAERARRARELRAPTVSEAEIADKAAEAAGKAAEAKAPTPFDSLGDQLQAIHAAAVAKENGDAIDPRLTMIQDHFRVQAAAHGATTTVGADGGFLVQSDLSTELLGEVIEAGQIAAKTSERQVGAGFNGAKFNVIDETSRATGSRYGGVRAYWVGEGGSITASRPKVRQVEITLGKLGALYVPTDELLADAVGLESFARPAFVSEMAFVLDDALLRGSGSGLPIGILNSDALVTVAKETGQAADTVILENVDAMLVRLIPSSVPRSSWFINQEVWPQLFRLAHVIGTGGVPAYIPPGQGSQSPFGDLRGRPVTVIEQASALGDLGDITLADWSQYILLRKGGIQQASSIHVYFDTDETVFRWILRVNGRPWRHSSVTPYKGSGTLSPFVALQARS